MAQTVTHGPFPIRLGWLAAGVVMAMLAVVITGVSLDEAHLRCDRERCSFLSSRILTRPPQRFSRSELKGVRVDIEYGTKGTRYGRPYLQLDRRELPLTQVSVDEANRFAEELEPALAGGKSFDLVLRQGRAMVLLGVLFLIGAVSLLRAATRGIGRMVIDVQPGALQLVRRLFGVPLSRTTLPTTGVFDVHVEWTRRKSFWNSRHSLGDVFGRLVLVTAQGAVPVSADFYRGYHLHRRAERELRAALMLPPRTAELEGRLDAQAAAMVAAPLFGGGVGAMIGTTWLGLCFGSILGIPLLWGALVLVGLANTRSLDDPLLAAGSILGAAGGVAAAFWLRRRAAAA